MGGAANHVSIAIAISIGTSLLAGFFGAFIAARSRQGVAANRDTAVSILFGVALLLIVLNVVAGALIAVAGAAYVGLLEAALLLTAAFAVVGAVVGLMRALRSASGDHQAWHPNASGAP